MLDCFFKKDKGQFFPKYVTIDTMVVLEFQYFKLIEKFDMLMQT